MFAALQYGRVLGFCGDDFVSAFAVFERITEHCNVVTLGASACKINLLRRRVYHFRNEFARLFHFVLGVFSEIMQ